MRFAFPLYSAALFALTTIFAKESPSYRILGLGHACVDLLIPVNEEFLNTVSGKKGGAEEIDYAVLTEIIKNSGKKPIMATGGSCANTLKALASLGEKCALIGQGGSGELRNFFLHTLKRVGVFPILFPGTTSPACVLCLVTPDGQRTMRFFQGSSRELLPGHLNRDHLSGVEWLHIEGYTLRNAGVVEHMLEMAKAAHVPASFDMSCFEIVQEYRELILKFLKKGLIKIVFANSDEVLALTGYTNLEGCKLLREWCEVAVVLLGNQGALLGYSDGFIESSALPSEVVDTTGAGDLFAAGFLYGYLNGKPLSECAYYGNLLGSTVIGVIGAEIPEEKWGKLRDMISGKDSFQNFKQIEHKGS